MAQRSTNTRAAVALCPGSSSLSSLALEPAGEEKPSDQRRGAAEQRGPTLTSPGNTLVVHDLPSALCERDWTRMTMCNTRYRRRMQRAVLAMLAVVLAAAAPAGAVLLQGGAHPCARPCAPGGRPLTCRYDFIVENYHSMSKACYGCPWNATDCARPDCIAADGVSRALVVINRMMPGPSLQVCLGDRLEVTVHNHMPEQSTSVHWHGIQQRGTPYMDGVPFVTQCPVQPHSSFRYSFRADTPGTHFWHSHTGCQRADGAVGLLTVRVPKVLDPHGALYDADLPEHGLLVWDWTHTPAASKFLAHHHAGDDNKADSVLINGKGVSRVFHSADGAVTTTTPREVFNVKQGLRYRFRLVNAGFLNCPLELSVDNHTLLVIASDGADVKPVRVDSLVSYAGERWDVVVEANQPVGRYWMRLHGLLDCGPRRAHEAAVLQYEGADPTAEPAGPPPSYDTHPGLSGLQVNPLNRGSADPDTITVAELQSLPSALLPSPPEDPALRPEADVQLFVSYDFYAVDNPHIHRAGLYGIAQVPASPHRVFTPQLNHISLSLPAFPLLSGRALLDSNSPHSRALCNETSLRDEGRDCSRDYCECTHVVRVPLGGVLEIVLVDQGVRYDANHPFHLHGHAFRVVAMERLGQSTTVGEVQRLDADGLIARNLVDPPTKDTVTVPDGGYTVLRVHADNPGYWLFHCHIEFHVELGMALVVKVGEHEDMPPVPRGFPQCGDWSSNSWLGDAYVDQGVDVADADALTGGNHIARVLGAQPPKQPPLPPTSTATSSTSEAATTEDATAAEMVTTAIPQDATTELLVLQDAKQGTMMGDKYLYDSATVRAEAVADEDPATSQTDSTDVELSSSAPSTPSPAPSAVPSTAPSTAPKATRAPAGTLSEFIMRVASSSSSSSSSRRRQPERQWPGPGPETRTVWVLSDPARPDLRYNVLIEPAPAPAAPQRGPRTAASTATRPEALAAAAAAPVGPRTPWWPPLLWTLVCMTMALA
ncbi:Laccase [Frankliniella fusca]|uniref:Laccase n=1 Tax=Frankliniella fusca TaxID=407009 RepID=A0AAE1HKB5_9NEOP|nr:Laccase [Frankliniella fusca]